MILDTNAISALSFRDAGLVDLIGKAPQIAIPFVCIAEYRFGILGSSKKVVLNQFLEKLTEKWPVLFPDMATLSLYAEICAQLKTAGTPIPSNDIWIAALVRQAKMPLVSRDQHFDQVLRIHRVSW
jgi:predicted nucleic acid-binding protein